LTVWVVVLAAPLASLTVGAAMAPSTGGGAALLSAGLWVKSIALAAGLSAGAVVLGWVPGRLLGSEGRGTAWLLGAMLACLLLPRYVLYYAWKLPTSPTTALGKRIASDAQLSTAIDAVASSAVLAGWYWPLAALILAAGWRSMDQNVYDAARLEARPWRRWVGVTLPMLAGPIVAAFSACLLLILSEFGTFHLAGVRTFGTELAVLFAQTGSTSAVLGEAGPVLVPLSAGLAWLAGRQMPAWSLSPPSSAPPRPAGGWRWGLLCMLLAGGVVLPTGLLVAHARETAAFARFVRLHGDKLLTSTGIALVAGGLSLLVAGGGLAWGRIGRAGRWIGGAMQASAVLAMLLPGSLLAVAILHLATAFRWSAAWVDHWSIVSVALAARFTGLAVILLRVMLDARDTGLAELAATDGATGGQTWWWVHVPRLWPLPTSALLLVTLLSITELPASLLLLPPGVPHFAQHLLNQMHYARDQQVIASCLVLLAGCLAAGAAVAVLVGLLRSRRSAVLVLAIAAVGLAGCESAPEHRQAEVVGVVGRTGRGAGEFLYPRAIDRFADGSLVVIDKTARVQHLSTDGEVLHSFTMPQSQVGKPTGVTVGPAGRLYVPDTHYHRVMVFTPAGQEVLRFGSLGEGDGQFIFPTDVAFLPDGRLLVSEYGGNDRISIYTPQGQFVRSFGRPGMDAEGLSRPQSLAVDADRDRIYVADACNHRIAIYDLSGVRVGQMGQVGVGLGELRYPYGLELLPGGDLLVCEYGNNRLQVFDPAGRSRGTWGRAGRQLGELAYPWAVAAGGDGRWFVVDSGSNRIQVWRP
jgi:ABC-type Fe3+ transport system permease subunit